MRYLLSCTVSLIIFFGCKNPTKQPVEEYNNSKVDFYPLTQYLDSQIREVVTTPYFIYGIKTTIGKTDSFLITSEQFRSLADEFIKDDPSKSAVKNLYKETVFGDASTQSITFNYSTSNPDLPLKSADILLDDNSQSVKRIFLSKQYKRNDSSVQMKLGWTPNESFFINRTVDYNEKRTDEQLRVVWNEKSSNK
jgi:hypothetical protein